jgi:YHS domain-containing protein
MYPKNFYYLKNPVPHILCLILISCLAFACNQKPQTETNEATATPADTVMTKTETANAKYTVAMVDNKKDPNCGMPVTAGIADTVHYNGKVYGFCSEECKEAFLKDPVALAKNADLK